MTDRYIVKYDPPYIDHAGIAHDTVLGPPRPLDELRPLLAKVLARLVEKPGVITSILVARMIYDRAPMVILGRTYRVVKVEG